MPQSNLICPPPPNTFNPAPAITILKKGTCLFRVHDIQFTATQFNPGKGKAGRFSPIKDLKKGTIIPTLYAGDSEKSALAESVFNSIVSISPAIMRTSLHPLLLTMIITLRDLQLVNLTENGLRRIGLKRNQLLESDYNAYSQTARWAEAFHHLGAQVDGMIWVSTQFDTKKSIVLFGDRVLPADLLITNQSESLYHGSGIEKVVAFANDAGITISM